PRLAGHRAGVRAVKRMVTACGELGIGYLTIYAFSVENWMRPKAEVRGLMRLLGESVIKEIDELDAKGVKVVVSGRLEDIEPAARRLLMDGVARTAGNRGLVLNLALSYGGRAELVDAFRAMAGDLSRGRLKTDEIGEDTVGRYLYHPEIPDPDLIIRTSGEHRLSNFLIWESAYSEMYFTRVLWPDFDRKELLAALEDYRGRERRFGRL
ncbi:MAG TPA: di-trans,poly-cis-decaprenylcistransferase, partial [candidate division Zixibacteria bacterium]|nr:di-trans,poly-cis-decaprenylcistransferase [candidate division Zixibacteria bacterium]